MRKFERTKFSKKANHLKQIKENKERIELEKCPEEIREYENLSIFNKDRIENMTKEKVVVSSIGEVELDEDEIALLNLPPKFAVRKRLNSIDMETDDICAFRK